MTEKLSQGFTPKSKIKTPCNNCDYVIDCFVRKNKEKPWLFCMDSVKKHLPKISKREFVEKWARKMVESDEQALNHQDVWERRLADLDCMLKDFSIEVENT